MDLLYAFFIGKTVVRVVILAKTGLVVADKCKSCYRLYCRLVSHTPKDCLFCDDEDDFVVVSK